MKYGRIMFAGAALLFWGTAVQAQEGSWYSYGGSWPRGFEAPRILKGISWRQFQQIFPEQIAPQYVVKDGKTWIQIRRWALDGRLLTLPEFSKMPRQYVCEIHAVLKDGRVWARILREGKDAAEMAVLCWGGEQAPEAGEQKTCWLSYKGRNISEWVTVDGRQYLEPKVFQVVTEEEAGRYKTPTIREAAAAMKAGQAFMVKLKTYKSPCPACRGSGIDEAQVQAIESAARNSLGFTLSEESPQFKKLKLNMKKPKCQACGGSGKRSLEEFRKLMF